MRPLKTWLTNISWYGEDFEGLKIPGADPYAIVGRLSGGLFTFLQRAETPDSTGRLVFVSDDGGIVVCIASEPESSAA